MSRAAIMAAGLMMVSGVHADEPPPPLDTPVLSIQIVEPGQQIENVVKLFKETRYPHPPALLAAWIHANKRPSPLGKTADAVITLFNPGMAREVDTLVDPVFQITSFDPKSGRAHWRFVATGDPDGAFASIGTAIALTDGAADEPIGGLEAFRLGGAGAPLMANPPQRLVLASDRAELEAALIGPFPQKALFRPPSPGCYATLEPSRLAQSSILQVRRAALALEALGYRQSTGSFGLRRGYLSLVLRSKAEPSAKKTPEIDPSWLDVVPDRGAVAAFAVAIDPTPETINAAFALADRAEKADPSRAEVKPLRSRLNLLAALARVRPDAEIWPKLRGVSGFAMVDRKRAINSALVVLHTGDDASAKRLADDTLPKLLAMYTKPTDPADVVPRYFFEGRPVLINSKKADVWISWGEDARNAANDALKDSKKATRNALQSAWGEPPPQRCGAFWPGRMATIAEPGTPLQDALDDAPPMTWVGRSNGEIVDDHVVWGDIRTHVKRVLDLLPFQPPPDQGK